MTCLPLRVLILEDHAFQRSVAVSMFKQAGCREVFEACDGAQALAVLQEVGPVDIALCDLQMEGMDGLEFFRQLGAGGQVKSIIISSSLSADLRRAVHQIVSLLGLELLGDVGKPLHPQVLRELLDKHRNAVPVTPATAAPLQLASEEEVCEALVLEQIESWYQPKFNLHTGQVCGVEVLSRWLHPQRGVLSPAVYLPILEQHGQMDRLLFAQLEQALILQREAASRGFSLNMAFNLQTAQLAGSELTTSIRRILNRHGAPGCGLTFELTESGLLEAPATSLGNLVRLRMMGCRLSIDDFGAGFSSLQRLCQLPFNEIKLDAEFVRNLEHEPRCRAAISSTLALGDSLGMSVVIEGIETDAQRLHLMALGCIQGQGYWYARPMSGEDLLAWLQLQGESLSDS
ncbi:EAL domain-containing protein [Pseudomonas mandelii]|uniref:EAL domain-containing response regulator n=1 Tax=Pseudomonas mandelii TaxID=75612 RepID=UPI00224A5D23|nr:EAL domain-containing response regulator [Pseudomonas mandelii]MCX2899997.1 EAL domain-containing response regulator [Pseudomonas mandelii]